MENALDLHSDSIHLFRRGSYGSALTLSVLAAEEIGKCMILEDLVWNSDINGPWTADEQEEWLRMAYDHRVKQSHFGEMAERAVAPKQMGRIFKGLLEHDKQRGVYVGLPRRGKRIDMMARFSSPRDIGRRRAESQITLVSDCLVTMCLGCSAGAYQLDIDDVHDGLTVSLARKLSRMWPHMSVEARRFAREVNPAWLKARRRSRSWSAAQ